ncbi:MAG: MarR family transcriptional regulator [Streptosporangiales bacterium]|nr:MarR family transcriptional regulator [Streptosporangiales bacterium]
MRNSTRESCRAQPLRDDSPQARATDDDGRDPTARLHDLIMQLVRATGMLQPEHTAEGRPISLSEVFALHELDGPETLSQQSLADRLHLEKSTVSRLVAGMVEKELVARERDPGNRRHYQLRLTEHGRRAHVEVAAAFHEHHEKLLHGLSDEERDGLTVGLLGLIRTLGGAPHP